MASPTCAWAEGSPDFDLSPDRVDVWVVPLFRRAPEVRVAWHTLSTDERARGGRFRFDHDRERFILARGTLRAILGSYLGVAPADVQFAYGPYGKPAVCARLAESSLHFNLSHSDDLALVAVAEGRELGVDLEYVRPLPEAAEIASLYFSQGDVSAIEALDEEKKLEVFFILWTRAEALAKAMGHGLSRPLAVPDSGWSPGTADPVEILDPETFPEGCTLLELKPRPGYIAALAVEGRGFQVLLHRWPHDAT